MRTRWKKAEKVLSSVPASERINSTYWYEGKCCAVTALGMALAPELKRMFAGDRDKYQKACKEACSLVEEYYGLNPLHVVHVLDFRGGWDVLIERIRNHDKYLQRRVE